MPQISFCTPRSSFSVHLIGRVRWKVGGAARTDQAVLVARVRVISRSASIDWIRETAQVDQGGLIVQFAQADGAVLPAQTDVTCLNDSIDRILEAAEVRRVGSIVHIARFDQTVSLLPCAQKQTGWTFWIERIPQNENAQTDRTVQIG